MDTTSITDLFSKISTTINAINDILPNEIRITLAIVSAVVIAVVIYKLVPIIS